jgi:hypothetical protein
VWASTGGVPVSLHELAREAEQKSPQIAASFHAWQASRNGPKQASALPETQLSLTPLSLRPMFHKSMVWERETWPTALIPVESFAETDFGSLWNGPPASD